MTSVLASFRVPKRQAKACRTNRGKKAGSCSQQTGLKPSKLLRVGFISSPKRPQVMKIQGKWFFFHFPSLALVGVEIRGTSCSAATYHQLLVSKVKPIHCSRNQLCQRVFLSCVFHPEELPGCFRRRLGEVSVAKLNTWSTGGLTLPLA